MLKVTISLTYQLISQKNQNTLQPIHPTRATAIFANQLVTTTSVRAIHKDQPDTRRRRKGQHSKQMQTKDLDLIVNSLHFEESHNGLGPSFKPSKTRQRITKANRLCVHRPQTLQTPLPIQTYKLMAQRQPSRHRSIPCRTTVDR
jgi:hypothetical protein